MTDDEIADRVRQAPELARRLYVHPASLPSILHVVGNVAGLNWRGVEICKDSMIHTEAMVWVDKNGEVLAVHMPEAINGSTTKTIAVINERS